MFSSTVGNLQITVNFDYPNTVIYFGVKIQYSSIRESIHKGSIRFNIRNVVNVVVLC